MVFTSQIFVFYFLPIVLLGTYALPVRHRNTFLALASYVFYGWWSPWFVLLMLGSTLIDWGCGLAITRPGASEARRKAAVATSVVANLALLGFFKYFVFTQENLNVVLAALGVPTMRVLEIVLPVGISFYTFQSMSYTIDLYRGNAERATSLRDFACYVAMFPQLVAGPIVRYREVADQLRERPQRGELFHLGVASFILGFAKKILLANPLGEVADPIFAAGSVPTEVAWFGLIAFSFQVYFDFSGYSDMAIGLGQMLGFQLPINFRSPYRAESATEFWQRWHISLSTWLRDYLYFPLGGNRKGLAATYRNLMITMVLGGLWHGASWNYVLWGAAHGFALCIERAAGRRPLWYFLPRPLRIFTFFVVYQFTWLLFRCDDLAHTRRFAAAMFGGIGDPAAGALLAARVFTPFFLCVALAAAWITWGGKETRELVPLVERPRLVGVAGLFALFGLSIVVLFAQSENPFLYFRF